MEILITLCARGGSKGIPGKNIKLLNGKPLIAYSISQAKIFADLFQADIALSTDSLDIKEVSKYYGLTTDYVRPDEISLDGTGKAETILHVLTYEESRRGKKYDFILDMDISSPLRTLTDLKEGFEKIQNNKQALNLFSVNKANRNPYFNMVELQQNGYYGLVKEGNYLSRQSAPEVFDMNASFYFYRRSFFNQKIIKTINTRSMIYLMPHICFDLDNPIDFEFMEFLIASDKLGFDL